jgi:hypothetical protein
VPNDLAESRRLDYEQNVQDAIAILPKLQTGLDVNVRFTGVSILLLVQPKTPTLS